MLKVNHYHYKVLSTVLDVGWSTAREQCYHTRQRDLAPHLYV